MLSLEKKTTHIHISLFPLKKEKKIQPPHSPTGLVVKINFKGVLQCSSPNVDLQLMVIGNRANLNEIRVGFQWEPGTVG